ncbi:D-ribose pyranase [Herbaspirillum sp. RTI4]|uniref:D-ribose pyranase n=1 Tax=Herbaspirillum sp. RTI4 TaxID=3048640 RepID=UPI002AB4008A|nr:D-ribose pyranase [Herbaspirillum sp. RTI4]MDY7578784.1 D-ribose pyranase [Herbaspirillum sp. RTI4]MEA9982295.1 D-ribose pyranase [Herbaspirillum sp. RTI4]
MKKTHLLNIALSQLIASLGHGDAIVIGDAGLPVPPGVPLIDLALTRGIPGLMETLETILTEMQVEQHVLASELALQNPLMAHAIAELKLPGSMTMTHAEFKRCSCSARAIVRTGECTPYANIILIAGVVF